MIIESKKTGMIHEISKATWADMGLQGKQSRFRIIDNSPIKLGSQKIQVPKVVEEIKTKMKKNGSKKPIKRVSKDDVKSEGK